MTMTGSPMIVQHSDERRSFATRHIGGETLIVPVTGQVADLEAIYVLNEVGSRIWELLRSPTTKDLIVTALTAEFDVAQDRAAEDVAEFLESLGARGLIQHVGEPAAAS